VIHDASSRRVDEALLEETVEDLYEHAPCGYLSTLPDGAIVKVNQTLLDWTGYARADLLNTRFQALLSVGSRMYYETHYAPLLQMQGAVNEIALELACADGRILPVVVNSRQKRDEKGAALFNRITLFDSTDRKRYERELLLARRRAEQSAKDKGELLSMLSHDIRNPLNAVMGVVQLLDRSELTDRQRRHLQLLRSSSENILQLLDRVLQLSRAEASSLALRESPFDVRAAIEDTVATYRTAAEEKRLALRCTIEARVPAIVLGDRLALHQVLANLLGNAIKFTESGGVTIAVDARERAADAVTLDVAVTDTGIGIPADRLERIFDEFTQASYETAARFGGSGLGLAISRKLLALYGSRVHVVSTPGAGSTFSFSLRLPVPPPSAGGSISTADLPPIVGPGPQPQ
jgi:PAS domain S-box-containing protein